MNDTRLFIGNLSYNTTEDDLRDCFAQAGAVSSVNLMMDKFTGKSRGFAFVEMASAAEAISTKANPRDLPVNLSIIKLTELTVPASAKQSLRSSSVVL